MKHLAFLLPIAMLLCPKSAVAADHYHMALVGEITDSTNTSFQRFIALAKAARAEVSIDIDSAGGDAPSAIAMYKALGSSGLHSTCTVMGKAASGAFLLLQACSVRLASADALLVTHRAYAMLESRSGVRIILTPEKAEEIYRELTETSKFFDMAVATRMGLSLVDYMTHVANGAPWEMTGVEALVAHAIDRLLLP